MKRLTTALVLGALIIIQAAVGGSAPVAGAMEPSLDPRISDPIGNFNFRVEFDGMTEIAVFDGALGLGTVVSETTEIRPDGEPTILKRPGRTSFGEITLERGYTANEDLWTWRQNIEEGELDLRSMTIHVEELDGTRVVSWQFQNAWPSKVTGPFAAYDRDGNVRLAQRYTFCVDSGAPVASGR